MFYNFGGEFIGVFINELCLIKKKEMKNIIGISFIILSSLICRGEIIDGPANVRIDTNGIILFSVEDSTFVTILDFNEDWCRIKLDAWVETSGIENNFLKKGFELTTVTNQKVCSIIYPTEIDRILYVSEDKVRVQISGFTNKINIRNIREKKVSEIDTNRLKPLIQYYLENEFEKHRECGIRFASYEIADIISDSNRINIYLWVFIADYRIKYSDGTVYTNSAGSVATKLNAIKHKNSYIITSFECPTSGEQYGETMEKIFPESVRKRLNQIDLKQLERQNLKKAEEYYKKSKM